MIGNEAMQKIVFQIYAAYFSVNTLVGSNCMVDLSNIKEFTTDRPNGWSLLGNAEEFDSLPQIHKQQIHFLDKNASKYIYDFLNSAYILTGVHC